MLPQFTVLTVYTHHRQPVAAFQFCRPIQKSTSLKAVTFMLVCSVRMNSSINFKANVHSFGK